MLFVFRLKIHNIKLYNNPDLITQNPEYTLSFKYLYILPPLRSLHTWKLYKITRMMKESKLLSPFLCDFYNSVQIITLKP